MLRGSPRRVMLAAIGIVKGEPFNPGPAERITLDKAARRALEMARYTFTEELPRKPGGKWYKDRQWVNIFPPSLGTPEWVAPTYTDIDIRAGYFSSAYSTSPVMVLNVLDAGRQVPDGVQGRRRATRSTAASPTGCTRPPEQNGLDRVN